MKEIDGGGNDSSSPLSECIFQTMKKYDKTETLENCLQLLNIFIRMKMQNSSKDIKSSFILECFKFLKSFIASHNINNEEIKKNYSDIYSFLTNAIVQWQDLSVILHEILLIIGQLLSLEYDNDELEERQTLSELLDFLLKIALNNELQRPLCFEIMKSLFPGPFSDHISNCLKSHVSENLHVNLPKIFSFLLSIFDKMTEWRYWNEILLKYFLETSFKNRKLLIDYSIFYLLKLKEEGNRFIIQNIREPLASNLLLDIYNRESWIVDTDSTRIISLFMILFNHQFFDDKLLDLFHRELYMKKNFDNQELKRIAEDLIQSIIRNNNIICKKIYKIIFDDFLSFKDRPDNFPHLKTLSICIETNHVEIEDMELVLKFILSLDLESDAFDSLLKLLCITLGIERIANLKEIMNLSFLKRCNLKFLNYLMDQQVVKNLKNLSLFIGSILNDKSTMDEIPPLLEVVYWNLFSKLLESEDDIITHYVEIRDSIKIESIATKPIINALNRYLTKVLSNENDSYSSEISHILDDFLFLILSLIIDNPRVTASYFNLFENLLNLSKKSKKSEIFNFLFSSLNQNISFSEPKKELISIILQLLKISCKFMDSEDHENLFLLIKKVLDMKDSKLMCLANDVFYLVQSLVPRNKCTDMSSFLEMFDSKSLLSDSSYSKRTRMSQLKNLLFGDLINECTLKLAIPELTACLFDSGNARKNDLAKILGKVLTCKNISMCQKFNLFLVGILSSDLEYICATIRILLVFVKSNNLNQLHLEVFYTILTSCILSKNARLVKNALKVLREAIEIKSLEIVSQKRLNDLKIKCRQNFKTWNAKTKKVFLSIFNK